MPRKLIVGLGNPGKQYHRTRHNLGFWALDILAEKLEASFRKGRCKASTVQVDYGAWKLTLAKPLTYMNSSGESVGCFVRSGYEAEDALVICDDVNLPVGRIRIRKHGGAGGHHGLESIIESIGSNEFPRIRIGVKPLDEELPLDLTDFVLQPFRRGEEAVAAESVRRAVDAILVILEENIDSAMNKFNKPEESGE